MESRDLDLVSMATGFETEYCKEMVESNFYSSTIFTCCICR